MHLQLMRNSLDFGEVHVQSFSLANDSANVCLSESLHDEFLQGANTALGTLWCCEIRSARPVRYSLSLITCVSVADSAIVNLKFVGSLQVLYMIIIMQERR